MARRKKQDDEPQENQDNLNNESDDTFGLPEVEYEPINRDEPVKETVKEEPVYETPQYSKEEEPKIESAYQSTEEIVENDPYAHDDTVVDDSNEYQSTYTYENRPEPMWPKILGILVLLLVVGGALFYFAYYQPKQKEERAKLLRIENDKKKADAAAKERARLAELQRQEAEQRRADSLANLKKEGSIEVLSSRTGQYYIVVASAVDDDLLMDYANKLVKEGKQVKLIPPFGKKGKFHRLAIESKDSYEDAQATANGMKGGDYGDQLWVVRY